MKCVWIPVLVGLAIIAAMYALSGMFVVWGIFACYAAAIAVFGGAIHAWRARRRTRTKGESKVRLPRWPFLLGRAAALVTIVALVETGLRATGQARVQAKSSITTVNLRGLACGLRIYVEERGDYPPELAALVDVDICSPSQLQSFGDPNQQWSPRAKGPLYSSFVYCPGRGQWHSDSRLVLAFEREPWTPTDLRLVPVYSRQVVLGNGGVHVLDQDAFEAALRADAALRRELGWPTP